MMRATILAAALSAVLASGANADPAQDALTARAEKCIQANAAEIANKAESYMDAQYFVMSVCRVEIERARNYETNALMLSTWKAKHSDAQLAGVSLDPQTGELKVPPGFSLPFDSDSSLIRTEISRVSADTELSSVAARAILSARSTPFH